MDDERYSLKIHVSLLVTWPGSDQEIRHKIDTDLVLVQKEGLHHIKKDAADFSGGNCNWVEGCGVAVLDAVADWFKNLSYSFAYRPYYHQESIVEPSEKLFP